MSNSPQIAVCLAAFNGKQHIVQQLKSILDQTQVEVKIYVSVDLSSDNTNDLVESFSNHDKRVLLLNDGEIYGSASKNFFNLLRNAQFKEFDYVALSDQDDLWQEDKLSHAVQKIKEKNIDVYSSNVTAFWPNGKKKLINKAQAQQQFDYMFESAGPGCTFVLTQKVALELQQFLIANQEKCQQVALHDWFIYAFARSKGYEWFIDSESHMLYRQHADNVVGANVGFKSKWTRWKKLRESWFIKQALLIADILQYGNAWPIRRLKGFGFVDRLVLIVNIKKLRRRLRDRIALALFLLFSSRK